jgi:2,4-dienoyl-CoA reductase-like NADH-dependent reductase (Old Yellow Enzyme family)/thioredoxin reductase
VERLFSPLELGSLKLKNRFVLAPILAGLGGAEGRVTRRQRRFYEAIAEGGTGLLVLEPVAVAPGGREHPNQLLATSDESMEGLSELIRAIHERGAKAAIQITHAGAAADPRAAGSQPVAPSACLCPSRGTFAEEMRLDEVEALVRAFGRAASKAAAAGADAVEIQGGQGHLIAQFLCPQTNLRRDAYGNDRLLFAKQVVHEVLAATGLPILLRVSCSRPAEGESQGGILRLAELAEETGLAALDAAFGDACHARPWFYLHAALPREPQEALFAALRRATKLPVMAGGRMGNRAAIQRFLDEGWGDAVTLARPLIADPNLVEKWRRHKDGEIMECGGCLQGCLRHLPEGASLRCTLNPFLAEEPPLPAPKPRSILVAGGGPSGMAAASFLAERGHRVTLADPASSLGGMLRAAAESKPALFHPLLALIRRLDSAGVTVLLGQRVEEATLERISPEVLVWAVGASQAVPSIPGLRGQKLMTAEEFFSRRPTPKGHRVLVLGATRLGLEAAERLAGAGCRITITEAADSAGCDMESVGREVVLARLASLPAITLFAGTEVERFEKEWVLLSVGGQPVRVPRFDWVLIAGGFLPKAGPPPALRKAVREVHILGGPQVATDLLDAIHSARLLAARL